MRDFATTGFLSNSRRTISFTIPLDKPANAQNIYFTSMDIQVRHINGGFLINEDVIEGDYTVMCHIEGMGILVNITRSEPFDTLNDIPLSVYIVEAEGEFYSEPIPEPVIHEKTFEELMEDLLEVWPPELDPEPEPEPEPEPSPEPDSEPDEPIQEPEEPEDEPIEPIEEEEDESESDAGSEQLHSDTEDSD